MSGDNFHFDITGAPLDKSLDIAMSGGTRRVTGWRVDEKPQRMVLYWTASPKANPLPAPLEGVAIVEFVKAWLSSVNYGPQPDHDGENGRGWRVYNESWGNVNSEWEAFVAIEPKWIIYGK